MTIVALALGWWLDRSRLAREVGRWKARTDVQFFHSYPEEHERRQHLRDRYIREAIEAIEARDQPSHLV